jgi:hypothetical protein
MEAIRLALEPATDWIPEELRASLPVEGWWLVELVCLLAVVVAAGYLLRALLRRLFASRRRDIDWDRPLREDLDSCPLPNVPPAACVYHVPVRLRLVVVAPGGKGVDVPDDAVGALLDRSIPGLGALVVRDQPRVCIWPAQLSGMGFTNLFHRCTPTAERDSEPSCWILLAGRAQWAGENLFVGLGLWSEEATTLGRRNLEPHQWLDVLRLNVGKPT